MTVHLGILAVMIAIAAGAVLRRRGRGTGEILIALLAVAGAIVEVAAWARESKLEVQWRTLATNELTTRAERIVDFLRHKGSDALEEIRLVGNDADTRALLSAEVQLSKTARRPVFLDLMERFPRTGRSGVTIYDARGAPRAWSGWSPTATMSLAREPSREAEAVEIRKGNIYTLLEVTHPVRIEGGATIGYVVYQEPLRIQFPLENRFLEVDDVLEKLEGGGGVRADVALELSVGELDDIGSIASGPLKLAIVENTASATATIASGTSAVVGRVSLSGLSKGALGVESLTRWMRLRGWLLGAICLLVAARLWFLSGEDALRKLGLPRGALTLLARTAIVALARFGLQAVPREILDSLTVFDPSWFASIRFGGLLRSPGDLLLTAGAAALVGREARQFLREHEARIARFAHRFALAGFVLGGAAALLVGSLVGLHWTRTMDVARNANVPLFSGLDPFTSVPVAALELSLLLLGGAFLLWGDALLSVSSACFSRAPQSLLPLITGGLALFASSVKMGSPSQVAGSDFLRPIPELVCLFLFRAMSRSWDRPRPATLLVGSVLAAATNIVPLFDGIEARRRELVELFALEHTESPSNSRHFLLESTLEYLKSSEELRGVFDSPSSPEHANVAFILWAKSPLASSLGGCYLRILDSEGRSFSTFSLDYPPELRYPSPQVEPASEQGTTRFRREEVGPATIDLYSGRVRLSDEDRTVGFLELSMAYFNDLSLPHGASRALPAVFTNLTTPDELLRFSREVPDRVDRYRGEDLVSSTDPEGGLGKRVPSVIVEALAGSEAGGRWVERRIGGSLYDLYCIRERDGQVTVGYLTFGIERHGGFEASLLLVRSALVTLVLTVVLLVLLAGFSWVFPEMGPRHLKLPRLGFRERVIAGFLFVSLLPTVLLGFAGRRLIVHEKREEFRERLEEDLRVARELLATGLADAARNATSSSEVQSLFVARSDAPLAKPPSVDGLVIVSSAGDLLGATLSPSVGRALLPRVPASETPREFFRRAGGDLYACALVPVLAENGSPRGGALAFRRIDPVLASELERRLGSAVSFFGGGQLAATSKPELYQSEILSDLVESLAYVKIELEGARRTLLESRVGTTSFLSSYAPLPDEEGEPIGILATLATFHGGGFDLEAASVLSDIYFLCLFVFTGAIAAAVIVASRLTRPISDLTVGAERIGAGALGHRIETKATGEIGALVSSFNSMSERLASFQARDRERREYIEAIIRHVGSGVVSFDGEGRVATVNEAAARILEVDPVRVAGHPHPELAGPPVLGALLAAVRPLLNGSGDDVVTEIEVSSGGEGELRSIRLVGTPLTDREGKRTGAVVVFEDLTDLIRSKKIKAWAEMARQVAHEIKNPLTPMKLSAQHLQQAWRDKHPKFERILEESTATIVDRCEALRRIAIEFSDYARMPGRQIRREDLGRLLREARRLYGDSDRDVRFKLDAPDNLLFTRVDKDEVMRLFINLIENSIQAMPEGGDLEVSARRENGSARVTIRDSGVGIPPENLLRIFEPSFSTKTGGAGLGLPICKAIMEDYGGSIDIASQLGVGTTVTLLFPVEES